MLLVLVAEEEKVVSVNPRSAIVKPASANDSPFTFTSILYGGIFSPNRLTALFTVTTTFLGMVPKKYNESLTPPSSPFGVREGL